MLFYRIISILLFPFLELYLFFRVFKKKEDKSRLKERFGNPTKSRPEGQIIWLHAVSVGEANSSLILIDELLKFAPKTSILFTTTTLTSAKIISEKLPKWQGRVIHQFLPIDSYFCVKNFLDFWRPRAAIFVESEIWPNLIFEARKMGALTFLVNARMSEKSAKKWLLARLIGFRIFDYFATIFAQSEGDKKRLEKLTNQEVLLYGNLKSQAHNLEANEEKISDLKGKIGNRKFLVAVSTHAGEEEIILQVHDRLKNNFPDFLTIIVPRHPNRAQEIKNLCRSRKISQRSQSENISNSTEIYLADSLGEMGIFYSLQNFAFIGGSLLPIGGHNPFEAIKLGCAVISGSQVFNFAEIYRDLQKDQACLIVDSADDLYEAALKIIKDAKVAETLNQAAQKIIKNSENIAGRIVAKMDSLMLIGI